MAVVMGLMAVLLWIGIYPATLISVIDKAAQSLK
jgi:hypothetical protein